MAQKLFDKASLVMIPSQYKEGKIYNIKPEDQSSSFEFERGSAATRVNSDGLIENPTANGIELIINGGFDSDSDWTKGTGWTIANGVASCDGTQTSTTSLHNGAGNGLVNGTLYKVVYTISNYASGSVRIKLGNTGYATYHSANGTYTEYVEAQVTSFPTAQFGADSNFVGSIDNVSVQEVNLNTPRLDYSGTEPSLLLEPQRQNLLPYSEGFSIEAYWQENYYNRTANSTLSPFGLQNATLMSEQVYTGVPSVYKNGYNISLSGYNTFSIYVKLKNNARYFGISFGSSVERVRTTFDFENNTFKTLLYNGNVSNGSASYEDFGNGWYKIIVTAQWVSSISNAGVAFAFLETDTYLYYLNQTSNNREFYVWGAQIEAGSYATSYIPTNGQTETRLADECQGGGDASVFNDSEGVLFVDMKGLENGGSDRFLSISDGTTSNRFWIAYHSTENRIWFNLTSGAIGQCSISYYGASQSDNNKIAVKYKQNDFALWVNGVEVGTDSSGSTFSNDTLNRINFDGGTGVTNMEANVRSLHYFPEALTDTELQQLTSNT